MVNDYFLFLGTNAVCCIHSTKSKMVFMIYIYFVGIKDAVFLFSK